jgi:hypothetical protein
MLELQDVLIDGNNASAGSLGGGIHNSGTLDMLDSTVSNNSAIGNCGNGCPDSSAGGGISNAKTLTVTDSIISGNSAGAGAGGGGLRSTGGFVLTNVAVTGNHAGLGGGIRVDLGTGTLTDCSVSQNDNMPFAEGNGAGILNSGTLTVLRSTLDHNKVLVNNPPAGESDFLLGGGVSNQGTLYLINSTLSANSAYYGGGIYDANSTLTQVTNCTITLNNAEIDGGGIGTEANVTIANSIVAGNLSPNGGAVDTANLFDIGAFSSLGHNLIGNGEGGFDSTGFPTGGSGDQIGTSATPIDAKLDALAKNGGLTETHALQSDSAAVDAGDDALAVDDKAVALTTDQRGTGFSRIVDGNSDNTATVDIGAFEFVPVVVPPLELLSAASVKTHTGHGDFSVALPLSGPAGTECRSSGGNHTLLFTFSNDVTSGDASVSAGSVSGSPGFSGKVMTVNLTGVPNVEVITVALDNVTDTNSQVLPQTAVSMKVLVGDVNADGAVNSGDAFLTRKFSGQIADSTHFRFDVNTDGDVNSGDATIVRSASGTGFP